MLARHGHSVHLTIDEAFPNLERFLKPGIKALTFRSAVTDVRFPRFWSEAAEHRLMSIILSRGKLRVNDITQVATQDCSNMMQDATFMSKVTTMNFDLVIFNGGSFYCPCNVILPHHLSIPAVSVTFTLLGWKARVPVSPAVTPVVTLEYSDRMTFLQRLVNVAVYVAESVYPVCEQNTTLLRKFAPGVTSWTELLQRTTLLYIVTHDHLLEWPEPQMPNVIHTPGLTAHPAGELPRQLSDLMEAAMDGVIILSFGSVIGQLPVETINKFLDAFSQVNQTVIFKYGGRNATLVRSVPRNVHMLSWLPQNDLLGHPNTVLFITHCGNNGQYESLYHGVPMIGFPLYMEQPHNALRMVVHGYGLRLDILKFTTHELVNNIHKVLNEKSFKIAVQKPSKILKSRPMTAQDTAAYWVEHVLKHGGEHLRTGAMDMPLYQFLMLDILLFILVVCFLSGYILKTILAVICQKCLRKQVKQKQH